MKEGPNSTTPNDAPAPADAAKPAISPHDLEQLADPGKQAEYRRAYLAQLRQRACPGCGETDELFS